MALINLICKGHSLVLKEMDPLATGSAGVDAVVLDGPDESWEGFSLSAAFKTEGGVYYSVVTDGSAPIPAAALAYKRFGIALYGTRGADGSEQRYTTNLVHVVIPEGAGSGGTTPPEPSESLYNQILGIAESAEAKAQGVVDRADAGEFTGPQGIQGPPGDPGISACLLETTIYSHNYTTTASEDRLTHSFTVTGLGNYISVLELMGCIGWPTMAANNIPTVRTLSVDGEIVKNNLWHQPFTTLTANNFVGGWRYNNQWYASAIMDLIYNNNKPQCAIGTDFCSQFSWAEQEINGTVYAVTPAHTYYDASLYRRNSSQPLVNFYNIEEPPAGAAVLPFGQLPTAAGEYSAVKFNEGTENEELRLVTTTDTPARLIAWTIAAPRTYGNYGSELIYLAPGEHVIAFGTTNPLPEGAFFYGRYSLSNNNIKKDIADIQRRLDALEG